METTMRRRRIIRWTVVGALILAPILVLGWRLPECTPALTADITYTIALDGSQRTGAAYSIRGIPVNILIDKDGIIRGIRPGAFGSKEEVIAWLDDLTSGEDTPPLPGVAPIVGHVAPDFTLPTLDGGMVALSKLRDKWVLINFWATWCRYCVIQMPYLQAAFEERESEVEFIGINVGESEEKVRKHIEG
jgi:peroxiredoxin